MLPSEHYITIIVDPGTEYEQEIYYDSNNGENYTIEEALTIIDRLNKRQRYVENFFKTSVQFHLQQVGFPARPRANPARIPRPMVDWSRMRPVPPPQPTRPPESGELLDLDDDPFDSEPELTDEELGIIVLDNNLDKDMPERLFIDEDDSSI
jgi:hypothetical protein